MASSKNQALIIILLAQFFLFSYLTEASRLDTKQAESPLAGGGTKSKDNIEKLKEKIPQGEEFFRNIRKRINETPGSPASEKCVEKCIGIFEKALEKLKKSVDAGAAEVSFDTAISLEADNCDTCMQEAAKQDPEIMKILLWYDGLMREASPSTGDSTKSKVNIEKLKEKIPQGEEFFRNIRKRINETPGSPAYEKCVEKCIGIFEKGLENIKKSVDAGAAEVSFDTSISLEADNCDTCMQEAAKKDPEIMKILLWYDGLMREASPSAGGGTKSNDNIEKLKEKIPTGEEFLRNIKKRINETPGSPDSKQCVEKCIGIFEKLLENIKKSADGISSGAAEVSFNIASNSADNCDKCMQEAAKQDPEILKILLWFDGLMREAGEEVDKYNS